MSELRSDWQAEACPTKAVRGALGWTGQEAYPTRLQKKE
jgi:hypothetical protein